MSNESQAGELQPAASAAVRTEVDIALARRDHPGLAAALAQFRIRLPEGDANSLASMLLVLSEPAARLLLDHLEITSTRAESRSSATERHHARDAAERRGPGPMTLEEGPYAATITPVPGSGGDLVRVAVADHSQHERGAPMGDPTVMKSVRAERYARDYLTRSMERLTGSHRTRLARATAERWPTERAVAFNLADAMTRLGAAEANARGDPGPGIPDISADEHHQLIEHLQAEIARAAGEARAVLDRPRTYANGVTAAFAQDARKAITALLGDDRTAATRAIATVLEDWTNGDWVTSRSVRAAIDAEIAQWAAHEPRQRRPSRGLPEAGHPALTAAQALNPDGGSTIIPAQRPAPRDPPGQVTGLWHRLRTAGHVPVRQSR